MGRATKKQKPIKKREKTVENKNDDCDSDRTKQARAALTWGVGPQRCALEELVTHAWSAVTLGLLQGVPSVEDLMVSCVLVVLVVPQTGLH